MKAQEQCVWHCGDVFSVNFRGMGIEKPVNIYNGDLFAEIFNR